MKPFAARIVTFLVFSAFAISAMAQAADDENLRYFVIQGKPKPEVIKMLVDEPRDPMESAKGFVASIPGAKLVDYYLALGTAQNLAIVALPDSKYAAAITWQRMATGLLDDMLVYEVVPAHRVKDMLETAKAMNASDAYLKK